MCIVLDLVNIHLSIVVYSMVVVSSIKDSPWWVSPCTWALTRHRDRKWRSTQL